MHSLFAASLPASKSAAQSLRRYVSSRPGPSSNLALKPVPRRPTPPRKAAAYKPPEPAGGKARLERTNNKSVWQSYQGLSYGTKLVLAAAIATFATGGLLAADKLEELFPARNHQSPDRRSQMASATTASDPKMMDPPKDHAPKLFNISIVDREPKPTTS
ncbi:hypothetical protein ACQY0O_003715 [Thecaphora frezii]